MHIKNLILKDFRNYKKLNINFDKGLNILYGDNAQGKTNILESLYLCANGKSHRTNYEKELINWDENESQIQIKFIKKEREERVNIYLRKNNKKGIAINGLVAKKSSDLIGFTNLVMFSPEDLRLIKGGPNLRRKYLDREISQINKIYLDNLTKYNKVINQRNKLLKTKNVNKKKEMLDLWDKQLVKYGIKIIQIREKYLTSIKIIIKEIYEEISGNKKELKVFYKKNVKEKEYEKKLKSNLKKDIKIGYTSVGPHLDDIIFKIGDIDIRKYGSQGQQRTLALAIKLAEIKFIKKELDVNPILLLDDVFSELDKNRQEYLVKYIKNIQTILSCTGVEDVIKKMNNKKVFYIKNGKVKQ